MEQPDDEPDDAPARCRGGPLRVRPLVSHDEARERQRDIQCVLAVVIDGVDAEIAGDLAGEQPLEVLESRGKRAET